MDIPSATKLSYALKNNSVIYFRHDNFKHSELPHYFVVLNHNKENDDILLLAYGTSQSDTIIKKRKFCRPETIISIQPTDYSEFTKTTYFDCNEIHPITRDELLVKIETGIFKICEPLPVNIFSLIKAGVLMSRKATGTEKRVIFPNYGA